ncbi:MAG: 30S ribosome-binding factor RbfA [Pseudomonadota bacterium]
MSRDNRRGLRLNELVRDRLAALIRRELDDPAFAALVITAVRVSDDASVADIGVRFLGIDAEPERRRLLQRLLRVAPRLRRLLGSELGLRRTPELRFRFDTGEDAAARVDELLREIRNEPRSQE